MSIRTYARSRVKRKSFFRKSELQMFLLISGGHVGAPKRYTNIWRLHTLEKVRETFQKITQKLCATTTWDLDKLFMNGFQFTFFVAWQWKRSIRRFLESRTSTGSETFSILIYLGTVKFVLLSIFTLIETICLKIWTKPLKNAKSQLLVGFCRSK